METHDYLPRDLASPHWLWLFLVSSLQLPGIMVQAIFSSTIFSFCFFVFLCLLL